MKTTVQELHKEHDVYGENIHLYLIHQYDKKTNCWKFSGYQCVHCGSNMKYASSITKHPELCLQLNKKVVAKEQPNIMLADRVTPWVGHYTKYTHITT
jgi:hypothetical protein